jgi:hypothetical protein
MVEVFGGFDRTVKHKWLGSVSCWIEARKRCWSHGIAESELASSLASQLPQVPHDPEFGAVPVGDSMVCRKLTLCL